MSATFDLWRKIILDGMKQKLKPLGFRKHGTTFVKLDGDNWLVVNLQSSQWNMDGAPMTMYVNLGVRYGRESPRISNPKTGPKEYECHFRERLLYDGSSVFDVSSEEHARTLGTALGSGALDVLLRYVAQFPTPDALEAALDNPSEKFDAVYARTLHSTRNVLAYERRQVAESSDPGR